jgi:chromate reductase
LLKEVKSPNARRNESGRASKFKSAWLIQFNLVLGVFLEQKIKVLAFAGILRKGSYNKALIRAAVELAPENMAIEVFDLEGIPPFNQEFEANPPQRVKEFKDKIRESEALLIATPEYNYSISGVLKNALDSASRPRVDTPLEGKPVAIMSASSGRFGGARAQYHLRQSFIFLNMHPVNRPEVMLSDASHNVDPNGNVTNEQTRQLIRQLLESLASWTIRLREKPREK